MQTKENLSQTVKDVKVEIIPKIRDWFLEKGIFDKKMSGN